MGGIRAIGAAAVTAAALAAVSAAAVPTAAFASVKAAPAAAPAPAAAAAPAAAPLATPPGLLLGWACPRGFVTEVVRPTSSRASSAGGASSRLRRRFSSSCCCILRWLSCICSCCSSCCAVSGFFAAFPTFVDLAACPPFSVVGGTVALKAAGAPASFAAPSSLPASFCACLAARFSQKLMWWPSSLQ